MTDELLPNVLPSIFDGLQDIDDDVRAVAATALVPVCDELVKLQPAEVSIIFFNMNNNRILYSYFLKLWANCNFDCFLEVSDSNYMIFF